MKDYIFLLIIFFVLGCKKTTTDNPIVPQDKEEVNVPVSKRKINLVYPSNGSSFRSGDEFQIRYTLVDSIVEVDSVDVVFGDTRERLYHPATSFKTDCRVRDLGDNMLKLDFYVNGKKETDRREIVVFSDIKPQNISYEVLNKFPHDDNAYTQGLEFVDGVLYESTGTYGKSDIRITDLEKGSIQKKVPLNGKFFAEGMTCFNGKVYQLTWKEQTYFTYDTKLEKKEKHTLPFDSEGWGITHSDTELIMSNGSGDIYFINPETFQVRKTLGIYTDSGPVKKLNELELVGDILYANVYLSNELMLIDVHTGKVLAIIDMKDLLPIAEFKQGHTDVLNGIAYNEKTNKLYVTGKNWPYVYEIKHSPIKKIN